MDPNELREPIVGAPMAGGPSTVALAAAVCEAGGLGFLAAGYRAPDALREDILALRAQTAAAFGVNVFVPAAEPGDAAAVAAYAGRLAGEAARLGVALGEPRADDDGWEAKLAVVAEERVPVVSFTFGCPPADAVDALHDAGAAVWVTVTAVEEAEVAAGAGADALVVQGVEAGGHRASFVDTDTGGDLGVLALLRLVAGRFDLPIVASGGLGDGHAVAAVRVAGAAAAQLGTAFLLTPEAGTSEPHRAALRAGGPTALTRAFSGRRARGIVNRFQAEHSAAAPIAYPEVHHLTSPLRAAARSRGEVDAINLWAGQAHALAREEPAGQVVRRIAAEARAALRARGTAGRRARPRRAT